MSFTFLIFFCFFFLFFYFSIHFFFFFIYFIFHFLAQFWLVKIFILIFRPRTSKIPFLSRSEFFSGDFQIFTSLFFFFFMKSKGRFQKYWIINIYVFPFLSNLSQFWEFHSVDNHSTNIFGRILCKTVIFEIIKLFIKRKFIYKIFFNFSIYMFGFWFWFIY